MPLSKKILLLGKNSLIGSELYSYFEKKENLKLYATLKKKTEKKNIIEYDPTKNFEDIQILISNLKPDFIINTIGITKHREEITNIKKTIFLNAIFPIRLSEICKKKKVKLIHFSTDCVFSGKRGNYKETDLPDAVDIYGITKSLGEIKNNKYCLTLRTSFIGHQKNNKNGFFEWVLSNRNKKKINGYKKAIYTGLTTLELTKLIYELINKNIKIHGLYNVSSKKISKYDLIKIILDVYGFNVKVVDKSDFFCDRSLNSKKFFKTFNYIVPTWKKMICDLYNTGNR